MVDGILLLQREAHVGIALKMLLMEGSTFHHLLGKWALQVHEVAQHLIVGLAWKEDLAGEELIYHAAHAPDIHGMICNKNESSTIMSNARWNLQ